MIQPTYRAKWSSEWPTEPGRYWFYGYLWGEAKPEMFMIEVWKISNGVSYVTKGTFIYKNDAIGLWSRANVLLPPLDELTKGGTLQL